MANYTDYLQLSVTPESTNKTFKNWRLEIDNDTDSNMTKIDDAIKTIHDKLDGVAAGAEVNQNAFSNVKVGSTTVAADGKTDTLELAAGDNITLTPDATNDKITIAAKGTTYSSKAAASGGTDVSLVTTGEKYTWNSKADGTHTHEADDITDLVDAVNYGPSNMVTIEDERGGLPIKSCKVLIRPLQIGSGDPAPNNICRIFGWTGARVTQARANLWTGEQMLADIKRALPNAAVSGSQINIQASTTAYKQYFLSQGFKENTQYTLILRYANTSVSGAEGYCRPNIAIHYTDGTSSQLIAQGFTANEFKTVAFHSSADKTISHIAGSNNAATSTIDTAASGLFEGYLTADDFEAFSGETIEYEFPAEAGTVYGGTLDVRNGTLTVDRKGYVFDGTESWGQFWTAPNRCFRLIKNGMQVRSLIGRASSHFANVSVTSGTTAVGYYAYNGTASAVYVQFRPNLDEIPDLASWKAWLAAQYQAGTPVTCYHNISTPEVYQLTPRKALSTFDGTNNFWCNAGQVTIEYGGFLQALWDTVENHSHAATDINFGVLPADRGGTGQTTLSAAAEALNESLASSSTDVLDTTLFTTSSVGADTGKWYRRPATALWNYIRGKANSNYYKLIGGTGIPSGSDLNDAAYLVPGTYDCDQTTTAHTIKHTPLYNATTLVNAEIPAFVLWVGYATGRDTYISQELRTFENGVTYYRYYHASSWTAWRAVSGSGSGLLREMSSGTTDVTDDTLIATSYHTGENGTWYRRPATRLWNYIKGKADAVYAAVGHTHTVPSLGGGYATCTTAAGTFAKTASLSGYTLKAGGIVVVKFTKGSTCVVSDTNPDVTLNINSTGAKPIKYRNSALDGNTIKANNYITFVYDGANYVLISSSRGVANALRGATSSADGSIGLVPAPAAGDEGKYLCGNGTWAVPTTQSSDARLKDVQGEIPDISSVRAVRFKWKDGDDKEHIGYLAQDVELVAPFLVGEDSSGYKNLDYLALLCAKVEMLERRVAELEAGQATS